MSRRGVVMWSKWIELMILLVIMVSIVMVCVGCRDIPTADYDVAGIKDVKVERKEECAPVPEPMTMVTLGAVMIGVILWGGKK